MRNQIGLEPMLHLDRRATSRSLAAALAISLAAPLNCEAERLPIKTYTSADGLAHDTVRRIVSDSRGFLWFCTSQGLSRFDGHSFTTYSVPHGLPFSSITDLVETSRGVYWVATNGGGVARFNRTGTGDLSGQGGRQLQLEGSSRFTVFTMGDDPQTNRVNALYEDRAGRLWAGTDAGLFVLGGTNHDATFQRVEMSLPSRPDRAVQIWAFVEDRHGSFWIGTSWGLVRRLPDGRLIHYAIQPTGGADHVRALLTDREGRVWIGHDTGLVVLSPSPVSASVRASESRELTLHTPHSALRTEKVLPPSTPGEARRYTAADGLSDGAVRALLQSSKGRSGSAHRMA